ncbi:acetyltransferase [Aeromicrobium sp. A1-2]|uniref:ACT domain-containing protein n=1 Tax=Aeromicrobium sp. A1-2 TaxID=2107713 RepID=UPI000E4DE054|nr:ACT domain-containing protein [Aeromicrobium sp. A1-2]AXT85184.1 acetyltransferase [Aeromicrobium sp. A1-2]
MNAITDLSQLLAEMTPELRAGRYVFVSVDAEVAATIDGPVMSFVEDEGVTLILQAERADALGLTYEFVAAWITLTVHSALDAVGLTAAVSRALTEVDISCNVVAAAFHDHLFVPEDDADRAVVALESLSSTSRAAVQGDS